MKKTFKDSINPAMGFISQESIDQEAVLRNNVEVSQKCRKAPDGYKPNSLYVETRSRRLQLLVQPSLHEKLKRRAQSEGTSVNEVVNSILQDALVEE